MEVLDLRAHVWGVEQDLSKVVSNGESPLMNGSSKSKWRGNVADELDSVNI